MTTALEKIKKSGERRFRRIYIQEWDLVIYVKTWTLGDAQKLRGLAAQDSPLWWAGVVQLKALDENGEQMFSIKDREELANTGDSEILQRLATQIGRPIDAEATFDNPERVDPLPSLEELTGDARKN